MLSRVRGLSGRAVAAAVLALTAAVSCTDHHPTQPANVGEPVSLGLPGPGLLPGPGVDLPLSRLVPLELEQPLEAPVGDVAVIGRAGGTIRLTEGALEVEVVFSPGALPRQHEITAEVPAGDIARLRFAPHGLRFHRPVEVRFALAAIDGGDAPELLGRLFALYIGSHDLLPGIGPLEVRRVAVDDDDLVFEIQHFSGYVLVSN